jgi:hypothetical protein
VTQFVDECRREWRRLRVPDDIANEMAADLEADLRDAEADGLSPEDVLGNGVFDPRSFAASWATERGVIPPPAARPAHGRRTLVAAVVGALAIAALASGIAILSTPHGGVSQVAIASPFRFRPPVAAHLLPRLRAGAPKRFSWTPVDGKVLVPLKPIPVGVVQPGVDLQPVGLLLVLLGIAGIAVSLVVWMRPSFRRRYSPA